MVANEGFELEVAAPPELNFDALCRTAAALFSVPAAFVSLAENLGEQIGSVDEHDPVERAKHQAMLCACTIRIDQILVVHDVLHEPCFAAHLPAMGPLHLRFYACAPIGSETDDCSGSLNLIDIAPRSFSDEQRRQLQDLANIVAAQVRLHRSEVLARERAESFRTSMALDLIELQSLRTSEAWSKVGHWRISFPNERITWSKGIYAVFGREPELGPPTKDAVLDMFHPDDREEVQVRLERAAAGNGDYEHRLRLIRGDGEVRMILAHAYPERTVTGEIIGLFGMCMDVTDLVRSERRLEDTSNLLRATLESMSQGLVALGADQRVRAFNQVAAELLDLSGAELHEGAAFADIRAYQCIRGDFREVPHSLRQAMNGTELYRLPSVYDWPLPSGITLEVRRSPLADGGTVTTFADVTQHRLAERAVVQSEHRFRLLAENATDIIVWSDLTTRRRYVSPAVTAVLGYEPEELIGTQPLAFVHPDDAEAYGRILDDLTSGRVERSLTTQRYRHRDGCWVWLEISFKLTRDAVSGIADGYVANLRDVSERKAMEEALRASDERYRLLTQAQLREAKVQADVTAATSAAILAQLAEGVIVTDAAGRITLVNAAAAMIHGVARLDVEPDAYSDTYRLYTEAGGSYPPLDLPLTRAVRGETVIDARWRVRRPDGTEVLAIGSAQPLWGSHKGQIGAVLTLRDDTARDSAERALRTSEARLRELNATLAQRVAERTSEAEAARAQAEAASQAKSDFLASMSHEIRTPLNGVIGYADLLAQEAGLSPDARRYAGYIRGAGDALLTIVNDVLDFSKIEAGRLEIVSRPFPMAALLDGSLAIVRGAAEAKGLGLKATAPSNIPHSVVGDEDRLRQVLLNLLNNAIKFTVSGSVELMIGATTAVDDSVGLRFTVSDTGIGVHADKRDRLFQRFSQVDGSISRDHGGTGLGLAISKRLVELMGGSIGFESQEGRGSTFWFEVRLPLSVPTFGGDPPQELPVTRVGRRLLLAEDVYLNQELARAILERAGHTVDVVGDGLQAVTAIGTTAYDLVLMDVQMPTMDGITATRKIRALDGSAAQVPIVAMTANVLPQQVAEFRAAGMDDHIGKPFRSDELLDTIDRWALTGHARQSSHRTSVGGTHDPTTVVPGRERTGTLLAMLAEELDQRFGPASPTPDREQLAQDAHAMVAATSLLGFTDLSRLCREVEELCKAGKPYRSSFLDLKVSCRMAVLDITTSHLASN